MECLISTSDLEKVDKFKGTWFAQYQPDNDSWYVRNSWHYKKTTGENSAKGVLLHNFIMGAKPSKGEIVDHGNHNTLNNTRENLKITSRSNNSKNRKGRNSNNKSGYRNVSWQSNKWVVQLQINGNNTKLGKFDDVDEAGEFAEKMRQKYYGEFAGNS